MPMPAKKSSKKPAAIPTPKKRLRPHMTASVAPATKDFFENEWPARGQVDGTGRGLDLAAQMLAGQTPPPPKPATPVVAPV